MLDFTVYLFAITFLLESHLELIFNEYTAFAPVVTKSRGRQLPTIAVLKFFSKRFFYSISLFPASHHYFGPAWFNPGEQMIAISSDLSESSSVIAQGIAAHEIGHSAINAVSRFYSYFYTPAYFLRVTYFFFTIFAVCAINFFGASGRLSLTVLLLFALAAGVFLIDELIASITGIVIMRKIFKMTFRNWVALLGFYLRSYLNHVNALLLSLLVLLNIFHFLIPREELLDLFK